MRALQGGLSKAALHISFHQSCLHDLACGGHLDGHLHLGGAFTGVTRHVQVSAGSVFQAVPDCDEPIVLRIPCLERFPHLLPLHGGLAGRVEFLVFRSKPFKLRLFHGPQLGFNLGFQLGLVQT